MRRATALCKVERRCRGVRRARLGALYVSPASPSFCGEPASERKLHQSPAYLSYRIFAYALHTF